MRTLIASVLAILLSSATPQAETKEKSIGFFLFTGVVVVNTGSISSETAFFSDRKQCLLAKTSFAYVYRVGMGMMDTDGIQNNHVVANFARCIDLTQLLSDVEDIGI